MNEATGPTFNLTTEELNIGDANYVQEALAVIGTATDGASYALLGYTPATARSVQIYKDGLFLVQGVDYTIDGRKIAFTTPFSDDPNTESCGAAYITTATVATIPAVEIAFDIPGQDVRVSSAGSLQVLVSNGDDPETFSWHDMIPQVHPITGSITYDVDPDVSLIQ